MTLYTIRKGSVVVIKSRDICGTEVIDKDWVFLDHEKYSREIVGLYMFTRKVHIDQIEEFVLVYCKPECCFTS